MITKCTFPGLKIKDIVERVKIPKETPRLLKTPLWKPGKVSAADLKGWVFETKPQPGWQRESADGRSSHPKTYPSTESDETQRYKWVMVAKRVSHKHCAKDYWINTKKVLHQREKVSDRNLDGIWNEHTKQVFREQKRMRMRTLKEQSDSIFWGKLLH